jgi:hypothetical protein
MTVRYLLLLVVSFGATLALSPRGAQAGTWCSFYDASTYNCGFNSYGQCLANISGVGGLCQPNYFENTRYAPPAYGPRKRRYR